MRNPGLAHSSLAYTYDGAHRLKQIEVDLGNKIVYTLDAMGNRTQETRAFGFSAQRFHVAISKGDEALSPPLLRAASRR